MLTRPCRAVHPPQHNTALGTLGPQVSNALSRVLVPRAAALRPQQRASPGPTRHTYVCYDGGNVSRAAGLQPLKTIPTE